MTSTLPKMTEEQILVFIQKLEKQTHNGMTMTLAARLDNKLVTILQGNMPNLSNNLKDKIFGGYGPLGSFSTKIDFSYALGYISSEERRLLHAIRDIRNEFAHSNEFDLNFDHTSMVKLLAKLPNTREPDTRNVAHFANAYIQCAELLDKHIESINLITALKEYSKKSKAEKAAQKK